MRKRPARLRHWLANGWQEGGISREHRKTRENITIGRDSPNAPLRKANVVSLKRVLRELDHNVIAAAVMEELYSLKAKGFEKRRGGTDARRVGGGRNQ